MDWAFFSKCPGLFLKTGKFEKKNTKFIVRLTREREKKFEKILKNLAMFFKLFFPEKAPDWSRTFPAKKQNSHMTNDGRGIFFQAGI